MTNKQLNKSQIFLVTGPMNIKVISGTVSVIGAEFGKGKTFSVPQGKKVPVETLPSSGEVKLQSSGKGRIEQLEKRTIPAMWDSLAQKIYKEKLKKILILGEVDTGKSFFTTYISNKLINNGSTVGILDCDVGQSDVGPPGTLGLAICKKKFLFLANQPADDIYFIGSLSPGLHLTLFLTGIDKLTTEASAKTDFLIIDTTGWVHGDGGRQVKHSKIDIINPDLVILLQRKDELEHLVLTVPPKKVFRLEVSKTASNTSQHDRKLLREMVSIDYFKGSKKFAIPLTKLKTERSYFKSGNEVNIPNKKVVYAERLRAWEGTLVFVKEALTPAEAGELSKSFGNIRQFKTGQEKYITIALLDGNRKILGLGSIEKIDFKSGKLHFHSPLPEKLIKKVCIIQFGSNRTDFSGREMGFISPGAI
ncbi:MAG: Clp1/GlmU family protein [bacterium]|nr:Clp1/GlmU family protein [bacterium]